MLAIYGTRITSREFGGGKFWCYECQAEQPYTQREARESFHFWFISLGRGDLLGSWVRCHGCQREFTMDALLGLTEEQRSERMVLAMTALREGHPHWAMEEALKAQRVPVEQAEEIVKHALGRMIRQCLSCGSRYREEVTSCGKCQKPLPEPFRQQLYDFTGLVNVGKSTPAG